MVPTTHYNCFVGAHVCSAEHQTPFVAGRTKPKTNGLFGLLMPSCVSLRRSYFEVAEMLVHSNDIHCHVFCIYSAPTEVLPSLWSKMLRCQVVTRQTQVQVPVVTS